MRIYLLAATAAAAIAATPALANDGSPYIGLEAGVTWPKSQHIDAAVDFTDPATPDILIGRAATVKHKMGYDVDGIFGYDFGMFRLEGELGYKHSKLKNARFDPAFITAFNTGAGTTFIGDEFDLRGKTTVLSGMVNALLDFGGNGSFGGSIGGGVGYARVKELGDSDSAIAWQLLAGVRTAVSPNVDVGLKYRYFRTGRLNFDDAFVFTGVGEGGSGGTAFFESRDHYSSHSLLLSLIYNFNSAIAPVPVEVAPPPPPPPAAPATQTCPDGSVILATSTCPLPPAPPPPPPVERGERGQ
jgi:opacity protein-like surface antigen